MLVTISKHGIATEKFFSDFKTAVLALSSGVLNGEFAVSNTDITCGIFARSWAHNPNMARWVRISAMRDWQDLLRKYREI